MFKFIIKLKKDKAEVLYDELYSDKYNSDQYKRRSLDENMEVLDQLFGDYWKPRFLINNNTGRAYEFMDESRCLVGVKDSDILWPLLENISEDYKEIINTRDAYYPSFIFGFKDGFAEVRWQINPDGRYYMDDDGYGMTNDREFNLYAVINSKMEYVVPFQPIKNFREWEEIKKAAIQGLK